MINAVIFMLLPLGLLGQYWSRHMRLVGLKGKKNSDGWEYFKIIDVNGVGNKAKCQ